MRLFASPGRPHVVGAAPSCATHKWSRKKGRNAHLGSSFASQSPAVPPSGWVFMRKVGSMFLVAALVVVIAAMIAVAVTPRSVTWACATCHSKTVTATVKGSHASTNCLACHAPGAASRVGFAWTVTTGMLPASLAGAARTTPSSNVGRTACLDCHASVMKPGVSSGSSGLRINHRECAATGSCSACHSSTAHGSATKWIREPIMEECTSCHADNNATLACDSCHKGKQKRDRLKAGPWQITHGPKWVTAHGMGDTKSCKTCHPTDYCKRCHKVEVPHPADFGTTHGKAAIKDRQACQQCHKRTVFCDSCHGVRMPHPSGFLKVHSSAATGLDDVKCARCHLEADCAYCHERHVHPGNAAAAAAGQPRRIGGRK